MEANKEIKVKYLIILLLMSCVTQQTQKLSPSVYYKNDICFTHSIKGKNRKFCGVGVLPYSDEYKLRIDSAGKINFFTLTTCHREITSENPDKGIFKKNGRTRIIYKPTLEKGKACPLYVASFSKKQNHAWGMVVLENPRYKLKAVLRCDGSSKEVNGVSICQSRKQLIQRIEFAEEVKTVKPIAGAADKKEPCPVLVSKDNKNFEFPLPNRECIYGFIGKTSRKIHMLYAVGYEEIIIREL